MATNPDSHRGGSVTRLDFRLTDPTYPFIGASTVGSCEMRLEEIIPRGASNYAEFFTSTGAEPDRILELAAEHGKIDAQSFDQSGDSELFEFVVGGDCPAVYLGELGALPREVYSADGEGRIVADVPPERDADEIIDRFLEAHPDAELVDAAPTSAIRPLLARGDERAVVDTHLDDRQRTILEAAREAGYYEWPRQTTATDLAARVDMEPDRLCEQLRRIEQLLIVAHADRSSEGAAGDPPAQSS